MVQIKQMANEIDVGSELRISEGLRCKRQRLYLHPCGRVRHQLEVSASPVLRSNFLAV